MMQMFGWEFTEDQLNAFKQMWIATDIDGDYGSRSMMEQINFLLKQWASKCFQDRQTFRQIIVKANAIKRKQYEEFLANVDILENLNVSYDFDERYQ